MTDLTNIEQLAREYPERVAAHGGPIATDIDLLCGVILGLIVQLRSQALTAEDREALKEIAKLAQEAFKSSSIDRLINGEDPPDPAQYGAGMRALDRLLASEAGK